MKKKSAETKRRHDMERLRLRAEIAEEKNGMLTAELAKAAADKESLYQRLSQKAEETLSARAERDRIMRVVDQFTSVSITAFSQPGNSPKELRQV